MFAPDIIYILICWFLYNYEHFFKEPANGDIVKSHNGMSSFPPIEPSEYKVPVPNVHSTFLKRYGLQPARNQSSSTLTPSPPSQLPPVKSLRPRCAKCGKRLALTEQYECRYDYSTALEFK